MDRVSGDDIEGAISGLEEVATVFEVDVESRVFKRAAIGASKLGSGAQYGRFNFSQGNGLEAFMGDHGPQCDAGPHANHECSLGIGVHENRNVAQHVFRSEVRAVIGGDDLSIDGKGVVSPLFNHGDRGAASFLEVRDFTLEIFRAGSDFAVGSDVLEKLIVAEGAQHFG